MIKFLGNPHSQKQISTIQEIIEHSFELVGDDIALHHLKKQNEVSIKCKNQLTVQN